MCTEVIFWLDAIIKAAHLHCVSQIRKKEKKIYGEREKKGWKICFMADSFHSSSLSCNKKILNCEAKRNISKILSLVTGQEKHFLNHVIHVDTLFMLASVGNYQNIHCLIEFNAFAEEIKSVLFLRCVKWYRLEVAK